MDREQAFNYSLGLVINTPTQSHAHAPYVGELGCVVVPVDETQEDLEHQQADLWVLCQREGQQRFQERAGQCCQHVGGLETCCHLRVKDI